MIYISIFAILTAIGARIAVPFPLVPFTLQTMFCMLAGLLLGPKYGAASQAFYMMMGLVGIPVFTGGGGLSSIFMPSFGYVVGFVACAWITGTVSLKLAVPPFDAGSAITGVLRFYRHKQVGKLHLQSFDLTTGEAGERDVSAKLDGRLSLQGRSIIRVGYTDRDEVNFTQGELMRFTVVDDTAAAELRQESRKGGADF